MCVRDGAPSRAVEGYSCGSKGRQIWAHTTHGPLLYTKTQSFELQGSHYTCSCLDDPAAVPGNGSVACTTLTGEWHWAQIC